MLRKTNCFTPFFFASSATSKGNFVLTFSKSSGDAVFALSCTIAATCTIESYIEKISIYKDIYEIGDSYLEGDSFLIKDSIITLDDYKQYQEDIDKQKEYLKQSKKTDEAIKRNREDVIRIVGADPFGAYPEDDAAELYASLLDFLDEDIDPPRFLLNIYIEIIKNFYLLDKINEEMLIQTSDSENLFANAKQIKTLNDWNYLYIIDSTQSLYTEMYN